MKTNAAGVIWFSALLVLVRMAVAALSVHVITPGFAESDALMGSAVSYALDALVVVLVSFRFALKAGRWLYAQLLCVVLLSEVLGYFVQSMLGVANSGSPLWLHWLLTVVAVVLGADVGRAAGARKRSSLGDSYAADDVRTEEAGGAGHDMGGSTD